MNQPIISTQHPVESLDGEQLPGRDRSNVPSLEFLVALAGKRDLKQASALLLSLYDRLERDHAEHPPVVLGGDEPKVFGDLAYIPARGTMYVLSDSEGGFDDLVQLFERERLLERLCANDPADQVYLVVIGDTVDRAHDSIDVLEFLIDLKVNQGCYENVILCPGNHELHESLQLKKGASIYRHTGFYWEVAQHSPYWTDFQAPEELRSWLRSSEPVPGLLKPAGVGHSEKILRRWQDGLNADDGRKINWQGRNTIWMLYNRIFERLPKTVLSGNGVYLAHAGFTTQGYFRGIKHGPLPESGQQERLNQLAYCPTEIYQRQIYDTVWSDQAVGLPGDLIGKNLRGVAADGKPAAGPGVAYGPEAMRHFLAALGDYHLILTGHQKRNPITGQTSAAWSHGPSLTIATQLEAYAEVDLNRSAAEPTTVSVKNIRSGTVIIPD